MASADCSTAHRLAEETADAYVQRLFLETLSRIRADIESGKAAVYSVDGYATPDGTVGVSWTMNVVFIAGPCSHTNAFCPDNATQLITVVCGEDRETAIYLNGELQEREDSNDAYEIARVTKSLPCRVETRNPVGWKCGRNWPQLLSDIPSH